jgi:hypothetical protein
LDDDEGNEKQKIPLFVLRKRDFYVQVMHPYIKEVPHSIFQAQSLQEVAQYSK